MPLYSLEKLIEWKLPLNSVILAPMFSSLLAREINWMETFPRRHTIPWDYNSLLAREINWMETLEFITRNSINQTLYSLEKLIEWKQSLVGKGTENTTALYSLEKLIEWKLHKCSTHRSTTLVPLYSLEKLIEWKQEAESFFCGCRRSLLAREINWMETRCGPSRWLGESSHSLLAREINWMETWEVESAFYKRVDSLLAREINWMETLPLRTTSGLLYLTLYSLEKLIEWKHHVCNHVYLLIFVLSTR